MSPKLGLLGTVKLKDTAAAEAGMLQVPTTVKLRTAPPAREGGPYCPVKPPPRVSAPRQGGVIAMNGRGLVSPSVRRPDAAPDRGGDHEAGAGQLAISEALAAAARRRDARERRRVGVQDMDNLLSKPIRG